MLVQLSKTPPARRLKKLPMGRPASQVSGSAVHLMARARVMHWNHLAKNPRGAQVQTLLKHCKTASETEFGKAHGFSKIRTYEDYKAQVPLRTYADFEPLLERMRKGERDILWPGLIPYYGQSSGSSNTKALHKFLPISMEQIGWQKKAAFDLLARYMTLTRSHDAIGGFSLGLLPPSILKFESPGVHVGSNPGIMLRHLPSVAKMIAIPTLPIRDIPDYDQKLGAIAEHYFDFDVRSISGTTCWFTVMFDRIFEVAKKRGIEANSISDIWPNLKVLFGGGVYAGPYKKIINEKMGHPVVLIDNYNATEGGVFAATDRLNEDGMLMLPDRGVFFEFVPRAEHGKANATRVPLWDVEPGVDYSVVLTTSSGLFGYYIGDFVRFMSIFPHRIEFAGRASGMLSLTQELVSYIEIERSFEEACKILDCTTLDYTVSSEVGVDETGKGRYLFFVEFDRKPKSLAEFTEIVDRELGRENRVYREHRMNSVAILPPRLIELPPGTTKKFMDRIGYNSVQNKFPRISDDQRRDILLSLLRGN